MTRLRVREIAEAQGMSMSRLARLADVHYKTVQHIWRDPSAGVNWKTLDKIARALKVSTSDLFEETPDDK